jgi:hypothetical protein
MKPTITAQAFNHGQRPKEGETMTFDGAPYVITKVTDTTSSDEFFRAVSYPCFQIEAEGQIECDPGEIPR